jgi:hypothetical protein
VLLRQAQGRLSRRFCEKKGFSTERAPRLEGWEVRLLISLPRSETDVRSVHLCAWGRLYYSCRTLSCCTWPCRILGFGFSEIMQRTIARLLLLFALAGNLIPLGLAATPKPLPACCLRHKHRCHAFVASNSSQPEVRDACCCRQSCGHAVVTARWAHPEAHADSLIGRTMSRHVAAQPFARLSPEFLNFKTTRGPPLLACISSTLLS